MVNLKIAFLLLAAGFLSFAALRGIGDGGAKYAGTEIGSPTGLASVADIDGIGDGGMRAMLVSLSEKAEGQAASCPYLFKAGMFAPYEVQVTTQSFPCGKGDLVASFWLDDDGATELIYAPCGICYRSRYPGHNWSSYTHNSGWRSENPREVGISLSGSRR